MPPEPKTDPPAPPPTEFVGGTLQNAWGPARDAGAPNLPPDRKAEAHEDALNAFARFLRERRVASGEECPGPSPQAEVEEVAREALSHALVAAAVARSAALPQPRGRCLLFGGPPP